MTLLALRQELRDLGYDGAGDPILTRRINAAYRELAGLKRWPWLERNDATLTTTAGIAEVTLADIPDLMWVDAVRLVSGVAPLDLEYRSPQDFQEENFPYSASRAVPAYWTEQFTVLRLAPTPAAAYPLSVDYLTTPPALVDDTDEPLFDTTYHDVLVWGAAVALSYRQRDYFGQTAKTEYETKLKRMIDGYGMKQRQTSDQVRPYWKH